MKKSGRRQAEPDFFDTIETVRNSNMRLTFAGTDDPQCLRVIYALLERPLSAEHEEFASAYGTEPSSIAQLRDLGLGDKGLPSAMVPAWNSDGMPIRVRVFQFSQAGSRAVRAWLRKRDKGVA